MKKKHVKKEAHGESKTHHKKGHHKAKPKHHDAKSDHHKDKKHHESDDKHSKSGGKKMWIAGAIKHPGALRKELHVKKGHKIPEGKLKKAAHHKGLEGRRARLAMTLKKLGHRKHEE